MRYSPTYAQDRAEIQDLMARYLFAMDHNDFDTYADLFTEDGTLEYARGAITGREAIRETTMGFKQAVGEIYKDVDGNPAVLRHVLCQSVIRVEGTRAWHTGFWFETANDGPRDASGRVTPTMGTFGTYEDELVKVAGEWKFAYRNIRNEFLAGRETAQENPVRALDTKARVHLGSELAPEPPAPNGGGKVASLIRKLLPVLALVCAPLMVPDQARAQDTPTAAPLSLEHRMLLRCSAAFALVTNGQQAGDAQARAFPALGTRGREFFVRASAKVMDEARLDRAGITRSLEAEARDLVDTGTLAQVMPVCLTQLPPQ
jgi:ketosteroid isomerase-like protein